jgi:hypothetical protein
MANPRAVRGVTRTVHRRAFGALVDKSAVFHLACLAEARSNRSVRRRVALLPIARR